MMRARPGCGWRTVLAAALTMAVLAAPLIPQGWAYLGDPKSTQRIDPTNRLWRELRQGAAGQTQVQAPEAGVLIASAGEEWRRLRNGPLRTWGAYWLAAAAGGVALIFLWRGRIRIEGGRSGRTVERWRLPHRVLHWYTAVLFLILALTGLSLLYGRAVVLPLFGKEVFGLYAQGAKVLHNYLGPLFPVGVILMAALWARNNLPARVDLRWLAEGGGILFRDRHPPAGNMNAGEKLWFWIVVFGGLTVSVTGIILDFPGLGQTRETMQTAQIVHAASAIFMLGFAVGHIYIGTLGTEGALEGMVHGRVDVNWARQHHLLWYEEITRGGGPEPEAAGEGEGEPAAGA
ncbi:formate dehydrogenase subunit gamma [Inmirania thermothiophila]|uniref:Formate dehydrogenase gamma subunit n=1 Tax=Inmirania thermothiophila TaxID=1750597 RepID=A0A3N1Y0G2_9GAMM|nr:formate dehydrogenase subunit gamma [Inmirania thermothiophila]ROR32335.1 formate dehydrogenase gamma subunit [Inmirania thermothiophila]